MTRIPKIHVHDFVSLVPNRNKIICNRFNDSSGFRCLCWSNIFGNNNSLRGLHNHHAIRLKIVRVDQLKNTERNFRRATDRFLSLYCAIDHRNREVLLTRKSNSAGLNVVSFRVCAHNGSLFLRRNLRDLSKIPSEIDKIQCTVHPVDAAQTPPARPRIAALDTLPDPTKLVST